MSSSFYVCWLSYERFIVKFHMKPFLFDYYMNRRPQRRIRIKQFLNQFNALWAVVSLCDSLFVVESRLVFGGILTKLLNFLLDIVKGLIRWIMFFGKRRIVLIVDFSRWKFSFRNIFVFYIKREVTCEQLINYYSKRPQISFEIVMLSVANLWGSKSDISILSKGMTWKSY